MNASTSLISWLLALLIVECLAVSAHASAQTQNDTAQGIAKRVDAAVAVGECETAYALLEAAGESGEAWAHLVLGGLHEIGPCARDDVRQAYKSYQRAVELGVCEAYARMGYLEPRLTAGPDGTKLARQRYRAAALCLATMDLSENEALSFILRALMGHRGIPEELHKALDWVRGIEQGSPEAKTDLALKLANGWGDFPRLLKTASMWLNQAARDGWAPAGYELGIALVNGTLGKTDVERGLRELNMVAVRGHREAKLTLGNIYLTDRYGRFSAMKAFIWLTRARTAGAKVDPKMLAQLESRLSLEEKRWAQHHLDHPTLSVRP